VCAPATVPPAVAGTVAPFAWLIEYGTLVLRDGCVHCLLPTDDEFTLIGTGWFFRSRGEVQLRQVTNRGTIDVLRGWLRDRVGYTEPDPTPPYGTLRPVELGALR